jgi:hypothetical protein
MAGIAASMTRTIGGVNSLTSARKLCRRGRMNLRPLLSIGQGIRKRQVLSRASFADL